MTDRWRLVPHFLVRSTGFPVELLDQLAFDDTSAAIDRLLDSEEEQAKLAAMLQERLAAGSMPQRRRWWKRVRDGKPIRATDDDFAVIPTDLRDVLLAWDASTVRHQGLLADAGATFTAELPTRRAALRSLVADPRFAEAVWLSSPQMLDRGVSAYLSGKGGPSAQRRLERQLVAYLQRFCAKNDTAAFFGPIGYGAIGTAVPDDQDGRDAPGSVRHREAFMAFWAVLALAESIARDARVRPYLIPRRSPMFRVDATRGVLELPGRGRRRLTSPECRVLELVDGKRSMAAITHQVSLAADEVLVTLESLTSSGVVRLVPDPPVGEAQPICWLSDWVGRLPSECVAKSFWQTEVDWFRAVVDEFADSALEEKRNHLGALEERFERLTGSPSRRGDGGFYVDRLLIYEEAAAATNTLRLSAAAGESLRSRLAPILDLYAAHACFIQRRLEQAGAERLRGLAQDGNVPLLQWIDSPGDAPTIDGVDELREAVLAQIRGKEDKHEVELSLSSLPTPSQSVLDGEVLISSPDILVLADEVDAVREGRGDLVIGECHDGALLWGWPLRFHPDARAVERDVSAALRSAAGDQVVASVLPSRRIKITPFEYPGPTVELASASTKPEAERIPAAEVSTTISGGRPRLHTAKVGEFLLHNGELHTVAHRTFGLPRVVPPKDWEVGKHTPRLRVGGVVVQRERWQVEQTDLFPSSYTGDTLTLLVDYQRAARRLGLPRFLFARVDGERKPVFVDGRNWFLLQLLCHLLEDGKQVVLTEMLPGPDQLWMAGPAGRYCSELRFTMYRRRPDESAATA